MQELEVERIAETIVPVPSIQKGHEGDAVMAEVNPCSAGHGPKETASAPQAGKERVCTSLDDSDDFSQWELGLEENLKDNLEQYYADDYEDGWAGYFGHYDLKEYGPINELFTPNWPVNASNIFGLLLRFSEESFWESRYKHYDVGYTLWGEVRYRVWKELLKQGLSPSDADRLMTDADTFSFNSFWNFQERSGSTQFADNIYEAECDRYLRGMKAGSRKLKSNEEPSNISEVSIQARSIPRLHFFAKGIEEAVSILVRSTNNLAKLFGDRCSGGGYDEKVESVIRTSTHDMEWHLMCALEQLNRLTATLQWETKDAGNINGGMDNGHLHSDQATALEETI